MRSTHLLQAKGLAQKTLQVDDKLIGQKSPEKTTEALHTNPGLLLSFVEGVDDYANNLE
jgi:hypothetical protein